MASGRKIVAEQARILAAELPSATLDALADAILQTDFTQWPTARSLVLQDIKNPSYRGLAGKALDACHAANPLMSAEALATAISTAALCEQVRRENQSVELVWTGPGNDTIPPRQTKQALLQVIDAATKRLIVVSYAVYNIPDVRDALVRSAHRGVSVAVIVESPDQTQRGEAYSTLKALGSDVAHACEVYIWAATQREKDTKGKAGLLHVKSAVADGHWAFLSSANLTEYAFSINMEMGVLFQGGRIPQQVQSHFEMLIESGVFVRA